MQTQTDKEAAIKSLLPLLVGHLNHMPMALRTSRLGESVGEPGPPSPAWATLDCDGWCERCSWSKDCMGVWWEVVREKLRRRHRLDTLRISLYKLQREWEPRYYAVWQVYIDPPEDDCFVLSRTCQRLADLGVEWMAEEIPGEITPLDEKRKTLHEQILDKRADGLSIRQIARSLDCKKYVVEMHLTVRSESALSAVG